MLRLVLHRQLRSQDVLVLAEPEGPCLLVFFVSLLGPLLFCLDRYWVEVLKCLGELAFVNAVHGQKLGLMLNRKLDLGHVGASESVHQESGADKG